MAETNNRPEALTVISGLRYQEDVLRAYNSMTFLFDENWSYNGERPVNLPAAFFYVKKCNEIMDSEVSQKTLIFYNSGVDEGTQQGTRLNVVSDNIVAKPKQYRLDVIIPYGNPNPLALKWGTDLATDIFNGPVTFSGMTMPTGPLAVYGSVMDLLRGIVDVFTRTVNTLDVLSEDGLQEILNEPEYNKNSIEAMWQRRGLVKMKMWNSWRYRTVAITNFEPSKNGTDSNAYEATLTLTEVPIVSLSYKSTAARRRLNPMLEASGRLTIETLSGLEVK